MSATSTGFSLLGATGQPALGLGKAVRRGQLLKEEQRTRTDRERLIPLRTVPTAALSPGEAQPSAGIEKKVTAHSCPFLPHLKPCARWPLCWQKGSRKSAWGVPKVVRLFLLEPFFSCLLFPGLAFSFHADFFLYALAPCSIGVLWVRGPLV